MKNTSIFIPLLLIGCLAALIYLAFAALRAAEENNPDGSDKITLNAEDYQDADATTTLDPNQPTTDATGNELEDVSQDNDEDDTRSYSSPVSDSGGTSTTSTVATPTRPATTTTPTTTTNGRYLVIAGSFRQDSGARERVAALRAAGFNSARLERFNRGTYAVALAGQYDRYRNAKTLADQVANRGFEVRVMKRR